MDVKSSISWNRFHPFSGIFRPSLALLIFTVYAKNID